MLFFITIFLMIFYIIGVLVYVRMKICEGISKELDKVFSDNDWHQVKFKETYVPLERNTYIAYYYVRRDPSKPYILKLKKEKVYPRWYSPEKLTDSCVVPGRKETKVRIRYISYFFFKKKLKLVQKWKKQLFKAKAECTRKWAFGFLNYFLFNFLINNTSCH